MKVIIFGASGYIGLPVALALVRNGHIVVGVSRSDKSTKTLLANEIVPVVGDIFEPSTWKEHLVDADVVIDCAAGDINVNAEKLFKAVSSAAIAVRDPGTPKIAYIYTSGTWVHGEDRHVHKSDGAPLKPADIVAWRPVFEQLVIASTHVRGIVIRPSLCYGRAGSLITFLFSQGKNGEISWFGTPGGSYATIHVDDLAECYLLATEKNHLVSGLIINCTNERTESVDGLLYAFAAHVGIPFDKVKYRPVSNVLEGAMSATTKLRPTLARSLLGWEPRKASLTDGIATYYAAYKALNE